MRYTLALLIILVGCGGGDDGGNAPIDAPMPPPIDGPPPAFVGRWRELPFAKGPTPEEDRLVLTITASGSITAQAPGLLRVARWELTPDDRLAITEGNSTVIDAYYVSADRFVIGALLPVGDVDGVVGTWRSVQTSGGGDITSTMTLGADQRASYTWLGGPANYQLEGTWALSGDELLITGEVGGMAQERWFQVVPDAAIGYPVHERLP